MDDPDVLVYEIVIGACDEGGYWASVPGLPGCVSQGETLAEVTASIRSAIKEVTDTVRNANK